MIDKSGNNNLKTVILTGLSGSGKTVVLNAFEDIGFFCVDNLPISLIESFVDLSVEKSEITKMAMGVDIRDANFLRDFSDSVSALKKHRSIDIIFMEASDSVLLRRFKESRRPHPLGGHGLQEAIREEAELLMPVRKEAKEIIDTSSMTPHQLRKFITELYSENRSLEMTVNLVSFGYKYGVPLDADLLFDVRFLPNPYFIEELKEFPGTSQKVKKFVLSQDNTTVFLNKLKPLLNFLVPLYRDEGKSYLTLAVGCTGGRHRSPAIIEEVSKMIRDDKLSISVTHRDLLRSS